MLLLLFRNSLQLLLISQKLSECEAIKVQVFLNISIFLSLAKFCSMGVLNIDWHGIFAKRAGFFRLGWKTDFIEINKIFYPKLLSSNIALVHISCNPKGFATCLFYGLVPDSH